MPNISEVKQKPSQEASTIHADEEKVRHTNRDFDTVEPGNSKIEILNRDNAIERGKDDNKNGLKTPEKGIITSEVNDPHTDDSLIEHDRTSLETRFEPEGWSDTNDNSQKEPKNNRIQPAGNDVSPNQNGYNLGGPDTFEYNDDLRVEEIETYKGANINKGNSPEARIIDESQQIDTRAEIEAEN